MGLVADYLELLDIQPGEFVGMFWKRGDTRPAVQQTAVVPASMVEIIATQQIPRECDAYLAPNPTSGPMRMGKGRGTEEQVTRCAALYADLDIKPGACPDLATAQLLIDDLSGLLEERPSAVIQSGGGLQPLWVIEPSCDPRAGRALLRRFGRLLRVVADARNVKVDSVFDTARVLRIPGSLNWKYGEPRPAVLVMDTGGPMDPGTVAERLREQGIFEESDDTAPSKGEVVSVPSSWTFAPKSCSYSAQALSAWLTEPVSERHPWYLKTAVRLECLRRNGCLTKADYLSAHMLLSNRFQQLLATQEPKRRVVGYEIRDIRAEAVDRASRKDPAQLATEVGNADGTGHLHPLTASVPAPVVDLARILPVAPADPADGGTGPGIATMSAAMEQDFWTSRQSLAMIYAAALARMCSPWSVLACCVARALAMVRPNAQLPALIGGPGSLNWFGAVVAPSGGGKGSSLAVARELVNYPVYQRNLGSGEGIVTAYRDKDALGKTSGTRESVMFVVDEIDNVSALGARSGSTLMPTVRAAFSGEALGFAYAGRGKDGYLESHSYRLTMICAVQPGRAATLLEDDAGGTPQRFMWFPGVDRRIKRSQSNEYQWSTLGLVLPDPGDWQYPREIFLPPEATALILDQRERVAQGIGDNLDAHATFAREKLAYALAVLDGRIEMTSEDWRLSGIAAAISGATRDWVQAEMKIVQRRDAERRGEIRGFEHSAADDAKADVAERRSDRIASWVLTRINGCEGRAISNRDLTQACSRRDRPFLDPILASLVDQGLLAVGPGDKGGSIWRAT